MGYVTDLSLSQFVSPFKCAFSAGTWTPTFSSEVITNVRTAADVNFDVYIPLELPGSEALNQGAKITSIDVWYIVATAALTDFTDWYLIKTALPADSAAATGEALAQSMDTAHDSSTECRAVDEHKATMTPTIPFYLEDGYAYYIKFTVDPAATSVFSLLGAQINYELRL